MPRSPRLEYPGALYHVTSRGVQRNTIFLDDRDRHTFLSLLARALDAGNAHAFAYCLMGNHFHVVLQTELPNLSALMHRVNSAYSQAFNRRHDRSGHVLEGRFKALHVDSERYLLEVCRYVDLNPVRADLTGSPEYWEWSSYRAHVGLASPPRWLATAHLHASLTGLPGGTSAALGEGRRRYAHWVHAGRGVRLWDESLRHGIYLGDEAFVERIKAASG